MIIADPFVGATLCAGVGLAVGLSNVVGGEVGINLGRGDVGVSEERLNAAQIGAALEQMCRKRVPKLMRRDRLRDAHLSGVAQHEFPKTLARERPSPRREKERRMRAT